MVKTRHSVFEYKGMQKINENYGAFITILLQLLFVNDHYSEP